MSFNVTGKQCQYCHAKLFDDDEVVICPECGAPYHRECYNSLGHCALEHLHGTEESYENRHRNDAEPENENGTDSTREEPGVHATFGVKCQMCGEEYSRDASSCPKCGTPNFGKLGSNTMYFDFLGGVSPDYDLGDGVTAEEAKRFVMANTNKYIPKFAKIKTGKKVFFNLLACLFPCPWMFSRKMYKLGALIGAIQIALSTVLIPYSIKLQNALPQSMSFANSSEYTDVIFKLFSKTHIAIMFSVVAVSLILHIIIGLFGDLIYRNYVVSTVKEIKCDQDDYEENLHKKGGVSLIMLIVGFLVTSNLPSIIASLAGVQ